MAITTIDAAAPFLRGKRHTTAPMLPCFEQRANVALTRKIRAIFVQQLIASYPPSSEESIFGFDFSR